MKEKIKTHDTHSHPAPKVIGTSLKITGDLQTTVEYANGTRQTIQLWNQFRVWDPGD